MANDSLVIGGTTYTNVAGFKATDSSDNTKTYVRPEGSQTITSNDTYDVTNLASVTVSVPASGTDVSDTTATAGDVLDDKYFYTSAGVKTEGTMTNNGATNLQITSVQQSLQIPAGYHNGNGFAGIKSTEALKITSGNIKSGVTILGVSGSLTPGTDVSDTTAVASDVLENKDFYLADGTKTTGTMVDYSGESVTIPSASSSGIGTSGGFIHYKVPEAGYYDTDSKILGQPTKFGNAAASDVASGKTFTSSAGFKVTGTASTLTLLSTTSMGTISTSSTTATDTGKSLSVSGVNGYELLIVETSVNTVTNNRHTCTIGLIWLTASSDVSTKDAGTIATAKMNMKISSSAVTTVRSSTTAYGIYPNSISIASGTATIPMYQRYNSTQTGTINGSYTTRVYGVKLFDLIGG